uniref:NADH-ubiquinone oxidoreductase chain 6 n=1 Tax=Semanotus bifasciatus TaxID=2020315 RepID=A0A343ESN7_9CUCU|nr:NADH dehydrogenase subunit 6 [Semanotus bifasciatus]
MTILLSTMIIMSWMFMFSNHPLSLGVVLLIQTLLISLISGLMSFNFWFSYILFLIMVGGMLILFIYMTSIASNEKFKFSMKPIYLLVTFLSLILMIALLDTLMSYSILNNYETTQMSQPMSFLLSKFMNSPMNNIMLMIITYLLITLIVVVKITNIQYGPLRQKF